MAENNGGDTGEMGEQIKTGFRVKKLSLKGEKGCFWAKLGISHNKIGEIPPSFP
ncbi:hypothetical protein [Methyloglobulus sp.]|uniref:hypothetical protein n=1 Tax=Methyloglobulus sp. TaxID=2518622 RepID=UPI0039898875